MRKRNKVILVLILSAAVIATIIFIVKNFTGDKKEPDKTGSWSQINQDIGRDKTWKKLVKNSPFKLGERKVKGTWYVGEINEEDYYEVEYGTYPSLDGSTVNVPMAAEFARQHLDLSDEDANSVATFSTTHYAYENLIMKYPSSTSMISSTNTFFEEKPVDLIIVTEPSDDEIQMAKDNNVEMLIKPVCYDAFVFITHKDNPVDSLTVEQIQKIYSGEITNWNELGGNNEKIKAFQREENSGSQTAMEKLVMQGLSMLPANKIKIAIGMGMLIDVVAEYENKEASIGYTYKYYIDTLYKNDNIKTLKVNGVSPDDENLRDKSYPFTTNYYGVIRKEDEQNNGGKFLDWILSEEGQKCIDQAGYIPMN